MDPDLAFRARLRDDGARSILVAAVVIIAAVVTVGLLPESSGGGHGGLAAAASPSPLTSLATSPSPGRAATPTPTAELVEIEAGPFDIQAPDSGVGRPMLVHLTMPAGWASAEAGTAVYKLDGGPGDRDANGPNLAVHAVTAVVTDVCRSGPRVTFATIGPSVDDMTTALVTLIGPARRRPTDVMLGGYPAKRFVLTDLLEECGGPEGRWLWENAAGSHFVFLKGGTATIYVVDVDGDRLVIASHYRGSPVGEVRELDAITASLEIEPQGRP